MILMKGWGRLKKPTNYPARKSAPAGRDRQATYGRAGGRLAYMVGDLATIAV